MHETNQLLIFALDYEAPCLSGWVSNPPPNPVPHLNGLFFSAKPTIFLKQGIPSFPIFLIGLPNCNCHLKSEFFVNYS